MKRSACVGIFTIFLGISYIFAAVVVDMPTVPDYVLDFYKKAQGLRNEFPELALMDPCTAFRMYEEKGKPAAESAQSWGLKREILRLTCNFESMWLKINTAVKVPNTVDMEYIAALLFTLSNWEVSWRALQTQIQNQKK